MSEEDQFFDALKKLREQEKTRETKRKFNQTIDLIVNLKGFDVRKESFSAFIAVPHVVKEKKIAAFLEKDTKVVNTIKKNDFTQYKEKKDSRKLARSYDAFMTTAKLMPLVATNFGRALGPVGKMPAPQLGILPSEEDEMIKKMVEKMNKTVRVKVKEPSIKVAVARENLTDKEIVENLATTYKKILESLPRGKDNIRNVKIKFTMSKPLNVEL
jgi:ribosomal protein L1